MRNVTIRFPDALMEAYREEAWQQRISLSALLIQTLTKLKPKPDQTAKPKP